MFLLVQIIAALVAFCFWFLYQIYYNFVFFFALNINLCVCECYFVVVTVVDVPGWLRCFHNSVCVAVTTRSTQWRLLVPCVFVFIE